MRNVKCHDFFPKGEINVTVGSLSHHEKLRLTATLLLHQPVYCLSTFFYNFWEFRHPTSPLKSACVITIASVDFHRGCQPSEKGYQDTI